jgi:hypothetical protein
MGFVRDYSRDFDLVLNEVTKRLYESESIIEYYKSAELPILEYLDPNKSYPYISNNAKGNHKWAVEVVNDPAFVISLTSVRDMYYVLDFYFVKMNSNGDAVQVFNKQKTKDNTEQGLEGVNYLDTLCKVLLDDVLPIFSKSDIPMLYFNAFNEDSNGNQRKTIFTKIISKFKINENYKVDVDGYEFKIYKKEK